MGVAMGAVGPADGVGEPMAAAAVGAALVSRVGAVAGGRWPWPWLWPWLQPWLWAWSWLLVWVRGALLLLLLLARPVVMLIDAAEPALHPGAAFAAAARRGEPWLSCWLPASDDCEFCCDDGPRGRLWVCGCVGWAGRLQRRACVGAG